MITPKTSLGFWSFTTVYSANTVMGLQSAWLMKTLVVCKLLLCLSPNFNFTIMFTCLSPKKLLYPLCTCLSPNWDLSWLQVLQYVYLLEPQKATLLVCALYSAWAPIGTLVDCTMPCLSPNRDFSCPGTTLCLSHNSDFS